MLFSPIITSAIQWLLINTLGTSQVEWSTSSPSISPVRIAIIGGGPSGISMFLGLMDVPEEYRKHWRIDLFESRDGVGGIWLPDTNFTRRNQVPETALYPAMYTWGSGPKVTIPGYPLPPGSPLQPRHWAILGYLEDIVRRARFDRFIRLKHRVVNLQWSTDQRQWNMDIAVEGSYLEQRGYDHVVIATGQHHYPSLLDLPGEKEWLQAGCGHREITHSAWFRHGEDYAGRQVVVVGFGPSGMVVANLTVPFAAQVVQSRGKQSGHFAQPPIPGTVTVSRLVGYSRDSLLLEDGTEFNTTNDCIVIYCTGYEYKFPFLRSLDVLDEKSQWNISSFDHPLSQKGKIIRPLYKHIFANQRDYPLNSLAFAYLTTTTQPELSGYANGLFLGHSIVDPTILDTKEQAGKEMLDFEASVRARNGTRYHKGTFQCPIDSYDWSESLISLLRTRSSIPLPPYLRDGKTYISRRRYAAVATEVREAQAWEHAKSISLEFAESFSKDAVTEDEFWEAGERLVEWENKWRRSRNLTLDGAGLC